MLMNILPTQLNIKCTILVKPFGSQHIERAPSGAFFVIKRFLADTGA